MSLRDAGLVTSTRGARGGYELVRPPAETSKMSEVLRALEGPIAPMFCATEDAEHATICDRTSRAPSTCCGSASATPSPARSTRSPWPTSCPPGSPRCAAVAAPATPPDPPPRPEPDPIVTDQPTDQTEQHLVIRGLRVAPTAHPDQEILQGIDLSVGQGEVHAIMGPNGSGKTTLAYALMGHPAYKVTGGSVMWKGRDILALSPDKRARLGLFLAFQYPTAVPGLSVASFIRSALNARLQGVDKNRGRRPDGSGQGRHLDARLPGPHARHDRAPRDGRGVRPALRERRVLGRREEAPGDAPDGRPQARDGHPRRDRQRASTSTRCGSSPRA